MPTEKPVKRKISVWLPADLKAEIHQLAQLEGRSLSNMLCLLVAARIRAERQRELTTA